MKDNFKIAVMLNGHPKHLETTQHLFKHWNNLYDNIEFDFFVSIWDTIDNDYESFDRALDINDLDWVTKFELLKEEDCPYDLKSHGAGHHQPHYCYTFKKVNDLRNSHDEKYDAVLQTRCDSVFLRKTLDGLIHELIGEAVYDGDNKPTQKRNPQITEKNIFSRDGSCIHSVFSTAENKWNHNLWTQDTFFFGHPKVMDIFSGMFDDIWINKDYDGDIMMHIFQAEYLQSKGIYNMRIRFGGFTGLIREAYRFNTYDEDKIKVGTQVIKTQANTNQGWSKNHPSPKQIINLINDRGLDWIFDKHNEEKVLSYFSSTPK